MGAGEAHALEQVGHAVAARVPVNAAQSQCQRLPSHKTVAPASGPKPTPTLPHLRAGLMEQPSSGISTAWPCTPGEHSGTSVECCAACASPVKRLPAATARKPCTPVHQKHCKADGDGSQAVGGGRRVLIHRRHVHHIALRQQGQRGRVGWQRAAGWWALVSCAVTCNANDRPSQKAARASTPG